MLDDCGFSCDIASGGVEAIDLYKKNQHSLVFMDLHMPDMDGIEAGRTILSLGKTPPPIIIALTADIRPETRTKCMENGFSDFLEKPVSSENLKRVFEKYF